MPLKRKLVVSTTLALTCAALGAAAPASAASGEDGSPPSSGRAAVGAFVSKTDACYSNPDGTQTCYKGITHDHEVLPRNGMISQTYGFNTRVSTGTGTSTWHYTSHSTWLAGEWKEAHVHSVYTAEDGCKTIYGSRLVNGTPTESSRVVCP